MQIINIIDQVFDKKDQERDWAATRGIMLHRCGINLKKGVVLGYSGLEVAKAFTGQKPEFAEVAAETNNQNAYSLLIASDCGPPALDGQVWQALPLDEIGWHGRQFSRGYIGIGWIADPRKKPLSSAAWNSAVDLCAMLCRARNWNPYRVIRGHGEEPKAHDGSKAPGERNACPGLTQQELNNFRHDVEAVGTEGGLRKLHEAGLVFEK